MCGTGEKKMDVDPCKGFREDTFSGQQTLARETLKYTCTLYSTLLTLETHLQSQFIGSAERKVPNMT